MEQTVHFQSAVTHDLATDKEFIRCSREMSVSMAVLRAITIVLLLFLQSYYSMSGPSWYMLIPTGILLVSHVIVYFRLHKGTLAYRQRLVDNNGMPMRNVLSFLDDHIRAVNPDSGNVYTYRYDQFRQIVEAKNFFILISKLKQAILIDKRTLTGGSKDALVEFLHTRCPDLKKHVSKGTLGRTVNIIYVIVLVLCILLTVWNMLGIGRISPNASFREIAAELEELGITGADDVLIADLEDAYDGYDDVHYSYRVIDYLSWVGMGEYDSETWEWTPSTNGVYWFDTEFFNVSNMYTDFLYGVSALESSLDFEAIEELFDEQTLLEGTGDRSVRFTWDGQVYTIEAEMYYDWFDPTVADMLNQIIRDSGTGKQLYFAYDGGQGFLVFYRDSLWALQFQYKTGIRLYTTLEGYFY